MPFEDDLIEVVTPERVGLNFPVAGLGSRFLAAFYDVIVIFFIDLGIIGLLSFLSIAIVGDNAYILSFFAGLIILFLFLADLGYYILFEYLRNGQTPGKHRARIRAMRLNGLPLDFSSAVIRNLIRPVDILLFATAVGFLVIFLSKLSQRPGDYVAGTVVVHDQTVKLEHLSKYLKKSERKIPLIVSEGQFRKLSDDDSRLIELFMERRRELNLESRRQLADQIAASIRKKIGADPDEYGGNENLIKAAREALRKRETGNW